MRLNNKSLMHSMARGAVAVALLGSLAVEPITAQVQSKILAAAGSPAPAGGAIPNR